MTRGESSPLVIGGMGGSGTRVFQKISQIAGYEMPSLPFIFKEDSRKWAHDNYMLARFFYDKWIDKYIDGNLSLVKLKQMEYELKFYLFLTKFNKKQLWGWKNPRTMYIIPFLSKIYPKMIYIHVIRDGRDHAFHPNFSYSKHQNKILKNEEIEQSNYIRKALVWKKINILCESNCIKYLSEKCYIQCRLEDLCNDPHNEINRIFTFLGKNEELKIIEAASLVKTPTSLARWKKANKSQLKEVELKIGDALNEYGYETNTAYEINQSI